MQKIFNYFNTGGDFASNIGIKLTEVHYGYAKAKLIDESKKLGTYEVIVYTEEKNIAFFTGTAYKTKRNVFEV